MSRLRRSRPGDVRARRILFIGLWIGLYSYYPFGMGTTTVVPMFAGGLLALPLLYLNRRRVRLRELGVLYGVVFVALVSTLVAQKFQLSAPELKALILLCYSLFIAYALYVELRTWRARQVLQLLTASVLVVLVGSGLEVFAGWRGVSDAVREAVYGQTSLYDRVRDLSLAGRARPSLFTREPSDVAKFVALCISCALGLAWHLGNRLLFAGLLALAGAGVLIIRSPIAAIPLAVVGLLMIDAMFTLRHPGRREIFQFLLLVAALAVGSSVIYGTLNERMASAQRGEDMSFTVRIAVPVAVGGSVLRSEPMFGLGLGSERLVNEYGLGATGRTNEYLVNALVALPVYLGIVGTIAMLLVLSLAVRVMGGRRYIWVFGLVGVLSLTIGSAYSPRLWCYLMVILVVGADMTAESHSPKEKRASLGPLPASGKGYSVGPTEVSCGVS